MHDAGALFEHSDAHSVIVHSIVPQLLLPHQGAPDRVQGAACLSISQSTRPPSHVIVGQLKVQSLPRLAASLPRLVVYPFRPSPQSLSRVSRVDRMDTWNYHFRRNWTRQPASSTAGTCPVTWTWHPDDSTSTPSVFMTPLQWHGESP